MKRCTAVAFALMALASQARAVDGYEIVEVRALYNYQMFCQGCHTPDGAGGHGVPNMKGHVGNFLKSQRGRAYLVRVPGAAYSVLDDAQLAEVLNWTIVEFAGESAPETWTPYSSDEVANYRREPLMEVLEYRKALLLELGLTGQ